MIKDNFSNLKYYWAIYKKNVIENPFYEMYLYNKLITSIIRVKDVVVEKGVFKLAYEHFTIMYLICFVLVWLFIVLDRKSVV